MNIRDTIGIAVKNARDESRQSQGDIEKKCGLIGCYLSRIENGHTMPSLETLMVLAGAIGTPAWRIVEHAERLVDDGPIEGLGTAGYQSR